MKALLLAIAITSALAVSAPAGAAWGNPAFELQAQGARDRGRGQERAQPGRDSRPERRAEREERRADREERRERLNDDERKALHRDLDKANRELYQRRFQ